MSNVTIQAAEVPRLSCNLITHISVNFDLLALNSDQRMREPHLTLSLPSVITHKIMIKLHTDKYSFDLTIVQVSVWKLFLALVTEGSLSLSSL